MGVTAKRRADSGDPGWSTPAEHNKQCAFPSQSSPAKQLQEATKCNIQCEPGKTSDCKLWTILTCAFGCFYQFRSNSQHKHKMTKV